MVKLAKELKINVWTTLIRLIAL